MFKVPVKVNSWLRDSSAQWGVAGGWAIDLFLNKETRPHKDIEVAILRRDQLVIKEELISDWRFRTSILEQELAYQLVTVARLISAQFLGLGRNVRQRRVVP